MYFYTFRDIVNMQLHSEVFTPLQKGHVNKYLNNQSEVM